MNLFCNRWQGTAEAARLTLMEAVIVEKGCVSSYIAVVPGPEESCMIRLTDAESGATLGSITEEQFQFLADQLEEESPEDCDYFIDRDTLELLEREGADAGLLEVLRKALGTKEGTEIRWARS